MKIAEPCRNHSSSEGTSEISQPQGGWCPAPQKNQVPQGRRTFSTVLSGRNFLRTVFQPLCGWLISSCRSATQLALAAMIVFFAFGATAQTTNVLSDAEIQGRNLARQLLEQRPVTNFNQAGVLSIRDAKKTTTDVTIRFQTTVNATDWQTICETTTESNQMQLMVVHETDKPNKYFLWDGLPKLGEDLRRKAMALSGSETMRPFADLGLEFLHWPGQKILRGDTARGRLCKVLESTNPDPSTNGYSRVQCWIDNETPGIVEAKAYDAQGKLLKEFYPKDLQKDKMTGQWQVGSMEIDNVQTGSRTWLKFDLKAK
jgi:hypothetical protein